MSGERPALLVLEHPSTHSTETRPTARTALSVRCSLINDPFETQYAVVALFDRHDTRDTGRLDVNQFCDGLFGIKRVPRADPKCRDAIQLCRERILARGGENGVRSLSRLLRMMDDNGDRNLDKIEMKEGLAHYGVELTDAEAEALFGYFDTDGSGKVSVTEFLVGVRGKMSKQRVAVVQQAFARLDKHNDRTISLQDLMEVYSAAEHDDVRSGRKTEAEVVGEFAALWDRNGDAVITEDDFIAYYKDISAGIDNDAYFALMLRNAWQLSDEKHKTWAATC
eukprot:TRINITY_DN3251_c0_g1_i1.p1 TRINITY_DN3251_c0_g1~~TRINITY_DN3251_c0_g1_i1.p1  ORF type:complete len:281 (+),score=87.73 TRINITY_DN3251_c0_g1_i1:378-1220(+)